MIKVFWTRFAPFAVLASLSAGSWADVTVVARVKASMFGQTEGPAAVTTYYKGALSRGEGKDGITLINRNTNQAISLDPKAKTYFVTKLGSAASISKDAKVVATGHTRLTDETRQIAGRPARKYVFDGTVDLQSQTGGGKIVFHVEQWTTTSVKLATSPFQMAGAVGKILQAIDPTSGAIRQLTAELGKMKGFPLSSSITMDMSSGPASPEGMKMTFSVQTDVVTLKEGPLSASLFQVPPGYKKVESPVKSGLNIG